MRKVIFEKFESSLLCSSFWRQLKIRENNNQKNRVVIAGKLLKYTRVKMLVAILLELYDESTAILFLTGKRKCWKRERKTLDCTGVNLEWKGGQLKLSTGSNS